ncbi:hypothetical protein L218DRAFT_857569 [Marasmius fiardii PR-910]|nr:hypothetical protein L218DRAFT_857569 [Marasmius fiardii PR-910]
MNPLSPSSLSANRDNERTAHSSVLWAHLLCKENFSSSSTPSVVPMPPLGPMDKNATSTRILLHDTQANLQQFAERVDKMTDGLNATKQEISAVSTLFKQEHETLVGEMVDLVNRCQTEIKKPLGQPAQSDKLGELQKILELRLDSMDRRLDILQMVCICSLSKHVCPMVTVHCVVTFNPFSDPSESRSTSSVAERSTDRDNSFCLASSTASSGSSGTD